MNLDTYLICQKRRKTLCQVRTICCQLKGAFATLQFELLFIHNIDILSMIHLFKLIYTHLYIYQLNYEATRGMLLITLSILLLNKQVDIFYPVQSIKMVFGRYCFSKLFYMNRIMKSMITIFLVILVVFRHNRHNLKYKTNTKYIVQP